MMEHILHPVYLSTFAEVYIFSSKIYKQGIGLWLIMKWSSVFPSWPFFCPYSWPMWYQMQLICKDFFPLYFKPYLTCVIRLHSWSVKLLSWYWYLNTQLLIWINCLINLLSNRLTLYIMKSWCLGQTALHEKWLLGEVRWFIDMGFRHMTTQESLSVFYVSF